VSTEPPFGLDAELLDDFFAEAEQHLIGVRNSLLHLETSVGRPQPATKSLEELFQNIHSFKGISAIAGLRPAEAVAHATEDFLRALTRGQIRLTRKGLEVLMAAAQKMELMVGAFRSHKPMPGYESLLAELKQEYERGEQFDGDSRPMVPSATLETRIEEAKAEGGLLWKYKFQPSRELEDRGVNINSVREQLSKIGEILKVTPIVNGRDALSFEFLLSAQDAPTDISAWEAKGITVKPAERERIEPRTGASTETTGLEELEHTPFLAPSHMVRVDLNRLDELMRITGEMVIHRSRLDAQLERLSAGAGRPDLRGVQEVSGGLSRSLRELREAIMRVRLVRVAEIFARMPFVVRDLSQQMHKKVRLRLEGQDTAIDKYLIERLKDPLLHLVRNAFSHGIESAEERVAASKPEEATIWLKAATSGDSVILHVRDDGRGVNPMAIAHRARKLGLDVPPVMDNQSILSLLCATGFSTKEDADRTAGRGVGMTVVCETVRELGGTLALETEEGRGTQFILRLPLTLAIAETLIVSAAGQTCAVPQTFVTEILQVGEEQVQVVNGIEAIPYRGGVLPIIRLAKLFQLQSVARTKQCMLVITSDRGSVGLLTEKILGRREVVVRALRDPLIQVPGITGATELGDGKPVLILDGSALTSGNVKPAGRASLDKGMN
jgi:two-component system, chemotaxis family, sensor kinase CheA